MPGIPRLTGGVLVALLVASIPALAAGPVRPGTAYVVAFRGSAADATAAVRDAGGTVVDVNTEVGVALVSAADDAFPAAVQAGGVVTGVTRNHSVGTVEPGMPHRWAEERPEVTGPPVGSRSAAPRAQASAADAEEPLADLQ